MTFQPLQPWRPSASAPVLWTTTTTTNGIEESHSPSFPLEPLAVVAQSQTTHTPTQPIITTTTTTHLHRLLHHHLPSLSFLLTVSQPVSQSVAPFPLTRLASQHHHDHDFPFVFFFSSPSPSASAADAALPPELRTRLQSAFAPERQVASHSLARLWTRCCTVELLLLLLSPAADAPMLRPTAFSSDPESRNQLTSFLFKSRQARSVRFRAQTMEAMRSKAVYGPVS